MLLAALFAAAVSFLKVGQHLSLQTQAYDLGVYANVLWNTWHGRFFENSISGVNHLGDHFSPLLALLAPLLGLWPNAAVLLTVQSLALAAAVPAVYGLAEKVTRDRRAALAFSVWFCLFPYFHFVSRFDFHEVALGIPLVLWMIYGWEMERYRLFWTLAASLILLREDYSLFLAGFGLYAALLSPRRREWRLRGGLLAAAGAALLAVEVFVLIPGFGGSWRAADWSYGHLGSSAEEMLRSVLNPAVLWSFTLGDPEKARGFLWLMAWTGGLALCAPRQALLWLIPVGCNLLSHVPWQYRFQLHYSATALPFLFYAMMHGFQNLSGLWARTPWSRGRAAAGAFFGTMLILSAFHLPRYFRKVEWRRIRTAQEIFRRLPPGDSVQTQNHLAPHLCFRRTIGLLPDPRPPRWVLIDTEHTGWNPPARQTEIVADFARRFRDDLVLQKDGFWLYHFPRNP